MDTAQARSRIREAFIQPFDEGRFRHFIHDLLNHVDESKATRWNKTYVKDAFKPRIKKFERVATYTDPQGEKLDVLIIHLERESSLERARTSLRNFAADYLTTGHGQDKSAVLAAFVPPDPTDWRFSFVKLEYEANADDSGRIRVSETLSPARRYSFLVGANEHSHTAQKQFLPLLEQDDADPSLADIEKAFDIEKVTKEFFLRYKDLFESVRDALNKTLKRNPAVRGDFEKKGIETDDFAKKLLGQIVFLYFLQKKGWFGVERGDEWGSGNKKFLRYLFDNRAKLRARAERSASRPVNFFNDVLEHLFYDALARERDDDYYPRFDCRIPFLNGGLFEPLFGYDWVNTEILLADQLFSNTEKTKEGDTGTGILDVFDRFNFTVNEAEPLEREVAVDPEMLGKVFENLLPENLRHKGGTYYTPRPIVNYMCQQSLINYLSTHLPDISRDEIETFIRIGYAQADFEAGGTQKHKTKFLDESISRNARRIDKLLEDITVCDPAIGSGAFPVGMMQEIVRARETLTAVEGMPERTAYELKRHAIQSSLYGVDIDPGAVEIAKLRLWLSLVVDEDDRDRIQALPNLDYKIMQGNSLLNEFAGVKLLDDDLIAQAFVDRDAQLATINTRISELQEEFFELDRQGVRGRGVRERFAKEIETLKRQKKQLLTGGNGGSGAQATFQDLHSTARAKLAELKQLHREFFDTASVSRKKAIRARLETLEWEFMEATLNEHGKKEELRELARHRRDNRKDYFLWKLHFIEVFQSNGGFDVVIANPPYGAKFSAQEKQVFVRLYQHQDYQLDSYLLFLERAFDLLRNASILAFIIPNPWLTNLTLKKIRRFVFSQHTIREISHYSKKVFDAVVDTEIVILKKGMTSQNLIEVKIIAESGFSRKFLEQAKWVALNGEPINIFTSPTQEILIEKLKVGSQQLRELCTVTVGMKPYQVGKGVPKQTREVVENRVFDSTHPKGNSYRPLLRGRDIEKYLIKWKGDRWIKYGQHLAEPRPSAGFDASSKLVVRQTGDSLVVALDNNQFICMNNMHTIVPKNGECDLFFILGLLNSRLFNYYFQWLNPEKGEALAEVKKEHVEKLVIRISTPRRRRQIGQKVKLIISAKLDNREEDASRINREIDSLVYKVYDLTDEEIEIVEKSVQR
jgi:type I restriction-modification system DNA methylase subunit